MEEVNYFEEWFNEHILPTIPDTMVLVTKAMMEVGFKAGFNVGVDVGCAISHR